MIDAAVLAAVALAAVHLLAGRLRILDRIPRSRWLSLGSGVSVAYVCMHILPELAEQQRQLEAAAEPGIKFIEHHVYLFALAGLSVFYGLERLVRGARVSGRNEASVDAGPGRFWIHVGAFAAYNALMGYLLVHRDAPRAGGLALFAIALAAHFLVNDYGLRHDHGRRYSDYGRWILAAAVLLGSLIGATTHVHHAAIASFFAFLAGAILLNVLKEELPAERESAFSAFALGAFLYTVLLLLS